MFKPNEIEKMPKVLEEKYNELEIRIMNDIVRRIKINGEITRSADWQIEKLIQLGESKSTIKKWIKEDLEVTNREIDYIYSQAIKSGYVRDKKVYKAAGKDFISYNDNEELQTMISAVKKQTMGEFNNLTQTLGFITLKNGKRVFNNVDNYYTKTLDKAMMDITTGAFDCNTVIKRTIDEMVNSGLRTINYDSGRTMRIESAVRSCLMTGVNQVTAKITEQNAEMLETEYFEVSYHGGARPSHQEWQGKVYSKKELETICGLGTVTGLCGVNCYHSYDPFVPGISERTYTDEELARMNAKENTPREYKGKEYTKYEALQEQRKAESILRTQKQKIQLMKTGNVNQEDITVAEARYKISQQEYARFSKAMDLPQQRERLYTSDKVTINGAKSLKIIEKRAQLYYNGNIDEYLKDEEIRNHLRKNEEYNVINWGKQNKHIKEDKTYIKNKSYFLIDKEEIERIALTNKGTGYIYRNYKNTFNNKEKITLDYTIGHYIKYDKDTEKIVDEYDTKSIIIHYSKKGIHIVPGGK